MAFDFPVETVREGAAEIVVPRRGAFKGAARDYAPSRAPVFYNPLMKMNRDIAVLVLQTYQRMVRRELYASEPLAGCGVRGIRFAKEVDGIREVYMNDINPEACKMTQHNIQLNGLADRAFAANEDANLFLTRYAAPRKRFDYTDVDPFGTPVTYLDSAVRATRDGGLIALTATDLAPLCGVYPKVALRKYGGLSLRTEYCHEIAIRLVAGCLAMTAARHEMGIALVLSYSLNHYVRVYALLQYGAKRADESLQKMGYVLHCFTCFHRETVKGMSPPLIAHCSECGSPLKVAGPLWLGELGEKKFCSLIEEEALRRFVEPKAGGLVKALSLIADEAEAPATYYVVDKICDKLNLSIPPFDRVIEKLKAKGFQASPTHFHSRGIKTDAPAKTVAEVIREYVR